MSKIIYTLGTSNRSFEEFLEILNYHSIGAVIDVRLRPTSKWFPHFKKENFKTLLKENKKNYFHFEKLGGYRTGGYQAYTKTEDFKKALEKLIKIVYPPKPCRRRAKDKNIAIVCAEKLPWKCHRSHIARILQKKKLKIVHLIDKEKIWEPWKEPREIKPRCQKT